MTRLGSVLALVLVTASAGACRHGGGGSPIGVPLRGKTQFESEWKNYLELMDYKSLAVAGDLAGVYVSGFAYAYPMASLAVDEALEFCEERRADRRIEEPCRSYAIGDERQDAATP